MIRVEQIWYGKSPIAVLLLPLSLVMLLLISIRKLCYRLKLFKSQRVPTLVIVVGNITIGGTGKTPLVCWLVNTLKKHGLTPGVISRGYGGERKFDVQSVNLDSDPEEVGDEALLIVRQTHAPMVVGKNRVKAATELINLGMIDVIISDDGLQHYALQRDIEIAVIDGQRRFGNSHLLPAGPLREPIKRLNSVDFTVANGKAKAHEILMSLIYNEVHNMHDQNKSLALNTFQNSTVHAVAGIGNPQRFFNLLRHNKISVIEHAFQDHYALNKNEISFNDNLDVIMTEKDAVKCDFEVASNVWYLPVYAQLSAEFESALMQKIKKLKDRH